MNSEDQENKYAIYKGVYVFRLAYCLTLYLSETMQLLHFTVHCDKNRNKALPFLNISDALNCINYFLSKSYILPIFITNCNVSSEQFIMSNAARYRFATKPKRKSKSKP